MDPEINTYSSNLLPGNDPQRELLHNEVHARPSQRIQLPALVINVVVINAGITHEQECEHLRRLPGQQALMPEQLQNNFLQLYLQDYVVRWERHSEFTRYSLLQHLPETVQLDAVDPELLFYIALPQGWLAGIPGKTFAATELAIMVGEVSQADKMLEQACNWFGDNRVVASLMGRDRHSLAVTDFRLRSSGFERMLVIMSADVSETRAGRVAQRLLEIETYRLMALKGLPFAKRLIPELTRAEQQLSDITAQLENKASSDQELLDTLIYLAARIERATVEHGYRFAATQAYNKLVAQRINELREQAIPSTPTIGEFMQRRLSPAIATVEATAQRLNYLSARVSRTSALLRTRVDIQTEKQNQQLLEKLTRGQELQLRLQSTVEGLSIAAISYYVISLLLYLAKAGKAADLPIQPELVTGLMIPVVVWLVWRTTRRIHDKFFKLP